MLGRGAANINENKPLSCTSLDVPSIRLGWECLAESPEELLKKTTEAQSEQIPEVAASNTARDPEPLENKGKFLSNRVPELRYTQCSWGRFFLQGSGTFKG